MLWGYVWVMLKLAHCCKRFKLILTIVMHFCRVASHPCISFSGGRGGWVGWVGPGLRCVLVGCKTREKDVDGVLSWPLRMLMLRGTNCDHVNMNNSNKVNLSLGLNSGLQILFIAAECHMFFQWVTSWSQIAHEYCHYTLPSSHSLNLFWCVMIKLIFD